MIQMILIFYIFILRS